jgi:hypothetical protein
VKDTSSFSNDGLLLQTQDSTEVSTTNSYYTYTSDNNLLKIESETHFAMDDDYSDQNFETHSFIYGVDNTLEKMYLIKNKKDSTLIVFSKDDKKNITIEKNTRNGESNYYYYDFKNRLTDVVHTYKGLKKLTPDYIFEYNNANQISQMTVSEEEGAYFFVWKYMYDGKLRTTERCFSKERRLLGTIEYEYK